MRPAGRHRFCASRSLRAALEALPSLLAPSALLRRASSLVRKTAPRPAASSRPLAGRNGWLAIVLGTARCQAWIGTAVRSRGRLRPSAAAATRRWPCSGNRKCTARPWGSGGQRPGPGSTTSRRARLGSRWRRAASSVSLASRRDRLPRCGSGFAAVPGCGPEQPADRAAGIGVVTADRAGAHSALQQPGQRRVSRLDPVQRRGNRLADRDPGPFAVRAEPAGPAAEPGRRGDLVAPRTEATFPVIGLVYLPVALLSGVLGPFPWDPGWLGCCATCPPSRGDAGRRRCAARAAGSRSPATTWWCWQAGGCGLLAGLRFFRWAPQVPARSRRPAGFRARDVAV